MCSKDDDAFVSDFQSVFLSVFLPACLPARLSACLPACLSVCLSVCLSTHLSVSVLQLADWLTIRHLGSNHKWWRFGPENELEEKPVGVASAAAAAAPATATIIVVVVAAVGGGIVVVVVVIVVVVAVLVAVAAVAAAAVTVESLILLRKRGNDTSIVWSISERSNAFFQSSLKDVMVLQIQVYLIDKHNIHLRPVQSGQCSSPLLHIERGEYRENLGDDMDGNGNSTDQTWDT